MAFLVRHLHLSPEYVLNMSPIQIDGYRKAVYKMLKEENGREVNETNSTNETNEITRKEEYVGTKYTDEQAKVLLAKREEYLRKKNGKDFKMPLIEALKTGAFALK